MTTTNEPTETQIDPETSALIASLDPFTRAYINVALEDLDQSLCDDPSPPVGVKDAYFLEDCAPKTLQKIIELCAKFQQENAEDLALALEKSGHTAVPALLDEHDLGADFYLCRTYGTGYSDRKLGVVGNRLAAASYQVKDDNWVIGADGLVYVE